LARFANHDVADIAPVAVAGHPALFMFLADRYVKSSGKRRP
jgi:hypothetical protein